MILLNGQEAPLRHFSDGTFDLRLRVPAEYGSGRRALLTWIYEKEEEMPALIYLTRHLQEHGVENVDLLMPYIPNARMDRVKTDADVFTLKYFAEIVNSLHFCSVTVFDPHSSVSQALFDRLIVISAEELVGKAVSRVGDKDLVLFFPDEGAMKRYSEMCALPFTYGMKNRDWETREIRGLTVCGEVGRIKGRRVLMVDDICSSGRTLHYAAQKLKELGASEIYLVVSHCENIVTDSELLHSDLVKKVFTTRSFLRLDHPKFEILKTFTEEK